VRQETVTDRGVDGRGVVDASRVVVAVALGKQLHRRGRRAAGLPGTVALAWFVLEEGG